MGRILSGKPVSEAICQNVKQRAGLLLSRGITPLVKIIRMGNAADDILYENSIIKNCAKASISAETETLNESESLDALLECINRANNDAAVSGIMVMRPLPVHIDANTVAAAVRGVKDVDCISRENLRDVFTGNARLFPCTAKAVITLLTHYGYVLEGKNAVVAGRSLVVGKPLAMMLLNENATVTVCHSKTRNLAELTKAADIVITAIGKPHFFGREHFTKDSVVIDVGMNYVPETGKMCGDSDFEAIKDLVFAITPPIGGLGAVTTMTLIENIVSASEIQSGIKSGEI